MFSGIALSIQRLGEDGSDVREANFEGDNDVRLNIRNKKRDVNVAALAGPFGGSEAAFLSG